ncbi:MAG: lactonase family protein [Bacteroides thetaiotaomicron]|nr:lactonase family protein [Bacteroides thetaiotaomicron]
MGKRIFALVGNWHYKPAPKGYSIFNYDPKTARMTLIETAFDNLGAGQQTVDEKNKIAYVVNEIRDQRGQVGGGGYVCAIKISNDGHPTLLNEKKSLCPSPCYVCLDKSGQYCIVVHHGFYGHVTSVFQNKDGKWDSQVMFDDAAVVLFHINSDGSIGDICDVSIHEGEGPHGIHMTSHLHSVVSDPSGEVFVICDKGLDRIYSYKVDRKDEKLILINDLQVEDGVCPRYGVFHPKLPVYYSNNEHSPEIFCFHYDVNHGVFQRFARESLQDEAKIEKDIEPSDLLIHPNGKYLYTCIRGTNKIAVMDIADDGTLSCKQTTSCGGENPRGMCISPDERYLIVANSDTGSLEAFSIQINGTISFCGCVAKAPCPATIRFLSL